MEPRLGAPGKKHIKKEIKGTGEKILKKVVKSSRKPRYIKIELSAGKSIKKLRRGLRGSGITKKIPIEEATEYEDDDPFVRCGSPLWSLEKALKYIYKLNPKLLKVGYKTPVTPSTFEGFSNTVVISLFRLYAKLDIELQHNLHIFYFSIENTNLPRFKNLTHALHRQNIFSRYPWLTTDEKLREIVDEKATYKGRKKRSIEYKVRKPFSDACKQYEIAKKICADLPKLLDVKIKPEDIPNTSHENLTNNNFSAAAIPQIPLINQSDQHLVLSQEYKNMISAINGSYQYNSVGKSDKAHILEEIPSDSPKRKEKKRSRWSSPPIETPITTAEIPIPTKKNTFKLTPLMHFVNRKIKLITQIPLSLGDLIVLVSYYYKLDYMEQQLLIGKMKILEDTKPNQAAYLRLYVRTTCPLYNEHEIQFKQLPQELIMSELNMDFRNITCIEDILEKDFCVPEENTSSDSLNDIKPASNEFDFGSAFL